MADAARNYEDLTGNEVDVEEGAIAQAFKQVATKEREHLIPIRAIVNANNLPGREFLSQYSSYLEGVLECAPDDCVKLLANEGKSFKESLEKAIKLEDSLTETALITLKLAKVALQQKYPVIQNLGLVTDELQNEKQNLEQSLSADSFYERMADIARIERVISKIYSEAYLAKHKERDELYQKALDEIKGLPDWLNARDQQAIIAGPLASRSCTKSEDDLDTISFDDAKLQCSKCQSSIAQMDSDIAAVSSIKKSVLARLSEISRPDAKIERVKISTYLGSSITSKTELDKGLKNLRNYIEKLLEEGKTVILE